MKKKIRKEKPVDVFPLKLYSLYVKNINYVIVKWMNKIAHIEVKR